MVACSTFAGCAESDASSEDGAEEATVNNALTASPTFVQVSAATPQSNQSVVAVKYSGGQSAGNTNVIAIGWNNTTSTITSVRDSAGNGYQLAVPTARGAGISQAIYFAPNIKAAAAGTNTITVQFSAATPYVDLRAVEYRGLAAVNPFDKGTSASGTGTAANSGTVTTTASGELVFGAGMTTGAFSAAGTSFTKRIITSPDSDIAEDRVVSAAGAYGATASLGGSAAWLMQVATFKAATTGGDTTPPSATITGPNGNVSGTVTISATASDNVGVAGVQFLVDNTVIGSQDNASPYSVSWNTTGVANGTHTMTARAIDTSGNSAVSAPVTITVSNNTAPAIFVGDYRTNDFSQWDVVQNKFYNSYGANYTPTYSASLVTDALKGKVARFEVRSGDYPGFVSGDRSEVQSTGNQTAGYEGQTTWYKLSTKFEPGFPQNHANLGWGLVNQWHATDAGGSPPIAFVLNEANGYLSLMAERQSSPAVYIGKVYLWRTPLDVGNWHDIKMKVTWSTSDTTGAVQLWHNGVLQTLTNGQTTYHVRTLVPGGGGVYYKEGYYRQRDLPPTGIVYHAGYRVAASEAGL